MPVPKTPQVPERQLMSDIVFGHLHSAIVAGDLQPGEVVKESDIETWMGASRTPVREAMDRLAGLGLLDVRPQRSTRVAPIDAPQIRRMFSVLGQVVLSHLSLVVPHLSGAQQRALTKSVKRTRAGADVMASSGLIDTAIAVVGNPRLRQLWNELSPHIQRAWNLSPDMVPGLEGLDTRALAAAVDTADGEALGELLRGWINSIDPLAPSSMEDVLGERGGAGVGDRKLLRDHAYQTIFEAIQSGVLLPGEILRDEALMTWLGMSKTPIRNALSRLHEVGLVEMEPGRSTRVAHLTPERRNRALMVSAALNEYAVRRFALSAGDEAKAALRVSLKHIEAIQDTDAQGTLATRVSAFIQIVTSACENEVLDIQVDKVAHELARNLQPELMTADQDSIVHGMQILHQALQEGDKAVSVAALQAIYGPTMSDFLSSYRLPEVA